MTIRKKTLAICTGIIAVAVTSNAAVTFSMSSGTATDFPTTSLSGGFNRSFSDVLATPAGATIAGGQAQGPFGSGFGWGEVFQWGGSANGDVLRAFSMVANGSGGAGIYQPILLDLGAVTFNANSSTFNPSAQSNLLSYVTLQPGAVASQRFLEFEFSGSDAVTLTVGHSYAFGFLNQNTSDLNFLRDSGTQSDPNGAPFQITSGGLAATTATVPGFGGGPRNLFFALYTEPVPEPTSLALLLAGSAAVVAVRRKK